MGRILRIGNDTLTNYSFLQTSAYNASLPAATTSPWPDDAAMDQAFTQPSPVEVTAQGVLITFNRLPDTFDGAMVKLEPTYDSSTGEDPFFEMWIHDPTNGWVLRSSIELSNPFNGIVSGQRKILDLTFFPFLPAIDMVWLTMNPGSIGTPSLNFLAIKLFGQCTGTLRDPAGGGLPDTCNPDSQFYTGFRMLADGTFVDCASVNDPPPFSLPTPDLCNPASVASYREVLRGLDDGGTSLNEFDGWFTLNQTLIESNCAGNTNTDPPTQPIPPLPTLPTLDLCNQDSIDAFRAAIAGDADQLAAFNSFIDSLTAAGYFDLVCPADDPPTVYVDPITQQPAPDPNVTPLLPFSGGPGGEPPALPGSGSPAAHTPAGSTPILERTTRFNLCWSGTDKPLTAALSTGLITPLAASTNTAKRATFTRNYGPNTSPVVGAPHTPAPYGLVISLGRLPFSCFVGIRMRVFRLTGSPGLSFSISNAGINTVPATGFCPISPDWIEANFPAPAFVAPGSPNIGDSYREFIFTGNNTANDAVILLTLPRVNPAQNDALVCTAGYQPRNVHDLLGNDSMAFDRGGCLVGLSTKLRAIWLHDVSIADYTGTGALDYLHVRPYGFTLDVTLRAALVGDGFDLGTNSTIDLSFVSDAQPVETCP